MSTSAFLIALGYHNTSRQLYSLLLKSFQSQHCWVCGVAIISASSSIKFVINNFGIGCSNALHPSSKGRLLIVVPIKEESIGNISLNLCKQKWSEALIFDNFSLQILNIKTDDPISNMFCGLLKFSIAMPLWIECPGKIIDFDIFYERRDCKWIISTVYECF